MLVCSYSLGAEIPSEGLSASQPPPDLEIGPLDEVEGPDETTDGANDVGQTTFLRLAGQEVEQPRGRLHLGRSRTPNCTDAEVQPLTSLYADYLMTILRNTRVFRRVTHAPHAVDRDPFFIRQRCDDSQEKKLIPRNLILFCF